MHLLTVKQATELAQRLATIEEEFDGEYDVERGQPWGVEFHADGDATYVRFHDPQGTEYIIGPAGTVTTEESTEWVN